MLNVRIIIYNNNTLTDWSVMMSMHIRKNQNVVRYFCHVVNSKIAELLSDIV